MKPKLPPLRMPCHSEQPPTAFATNLGYSVRIIDGSVWRVKPLEKLCQGEAAADFIAEHLTDRYAAYWLESSVRNWRIQAEYRSNESAAKLRYETQGKRKSA